MAKIWTAPNNTYASGSNRGNGGHAGILADEQKLVRDPDEENS